MFLFGRTSLVAPRTRLLRRSPFPTTNIKMTNGNLNSPVALPSPRPSGVGPATLLQSYSSSTPTSPAPAPSEPKPTVSRIEVERKFLPTPELISHLGGFINRFGINYNVLERGCNEAYKPKNNQQNQSSSSPPPPLLRFKPVHDQTLRDTYYDLDPKLISESRPRRLSLSDQGIWVRRRRHITRYPPYRDDGGRAANEKGDRLEAKIRLGGDYASSQFHEIEGDEEVKEYLVKEHQVSFSSFSSSSFSSSSWGDEAEKKKKKKEQQQLVELADIVSWRQTWVVREEREEKEEEEEGAGEVVVVKKGEEIMVVVIDHSVEPGSENRFGEPDNFRFTHVVGEVEITRDVVIAAGEGANKEEEEEKAAVAAAREMEKRMDGFLARYPHLFATEPKPKGKLGAYFEWKKEEKEWSGWEKDWINGGGGDGGEKGLVGPEIPSWSPLYNMVG